MAYFPRYDYQDSGLLFLNSRLLDLFRSWNWCGAVQERYLSHLQERSCAWFSKEEHNTVWGTETSENMIQKFPELKNEVLCRDVQRDLIAKEFLYHDYCYNILTKPVYKGKECNDNNYDDSESSFTATENFIQVTFWKIIKLFRWGQWQVYTTWSKEMIADTATSWKRSWKIGIDFFHLLIDNTDFLVHKIR